MTVVVRLIVDVLNCTYPNRLVRKVNSVYAAPTKRAVLPLATLEGNQKRYLTPFQRLMHKFFVAEALWFVA